jgi:small subunit ribosomal protein S17e
MGRIKTKQIKATTFTLLEQYNDRFSKDFTHNKKQMDVLTTFHSKKIRNAIAGYLSRLKKAQK